MNDKIMHSMCPRKFSGGVPWRHASIFREFVIVVGRCGEAAAP